MSFQREINGIWEKLYEDVKTTAPLLSIYSLKFGSSENEYWNKTKLFSAITMKDLECKKTVSDSLPLEENAALHTCPQQESLCWKHLIHRSRMNVGQPVLSCQAHFQNVKSTSHDGNSSSSWRSVHFPSLVNFPVRHWKVNWEGRWMPVALTAGEQGDMF